jgi:glutaminyl-tRNA synthetase
VRCTGFEKDAQGNVTLVHCTYDPDTRSGTPGADARKVKGNIHWLFAADAPRAEVRLYDRLFGTPFPGSSAPAGVVHAPEQGHSMVAGEDDAEQGESAERSFIDDLNAHSKRVIEAYVEPALASAAPEERYQFERHGYFVADIDDHRPGAPVFNRAVTLRDSWGKSG